MGIGALLLLSIAGGGTYWWLASHRAPAEVATPVKEEVVPQASKQLRIAMTGDMLAHDSVVAQAKTASGYDFTPYFTTVRPLYKEADIVFCNPETPVAGDSLGVSGYPSFNAPRAFALGLVTGAGCNVINMATNHISDKGQAGIDASRAIWREQPLLAVSGASSSVEEQNTVSYFTANDITCAFVAFADFSNLSPPQSYSLNRYHDTALVQRLLAEATQNAEFVIVSAHWGTEDSTAVNADQKAAAQLFAESGADLIIGTGPHVLQTYETLRVSDTDGSERVVPVWYSLGNLLSSQLQLNELTGGIAQQTFEWRSNKPVITDTSFDATFMSYDWPAADRAAEVLSSRTNLRLQPLKQASSAIVSMFPSASYEERLGFVKTTLGPAVTIR